MGTALFSLLTALAAVPYTIGDLGNIIPPEYKAKLFAVALTSAFILRVWNASLQKDKEVRGGVVDQDRHGDIATPQDPVAPAPKPTTTTNNLKK
ncbi:MAG: hypothetical protein H0U23_17870 [Blastocatellia bacterium]|nr:hypothetical protein [Blastocatellia bacterium]